MEYKKDQIAEMLIAYGNMRRFERALEDARENYELNINHSSYLSTSFPIIESAKSWLKWSEIQIPKEIRKDTRIIRELKSLKDLIAREEKRLKQIEMGNN